MPVNTYPLINEIISKRVIAVIGYYDGKSKKPKHVMPIWIIFDDNETFIELTEQDYRDYHDCSMSARHFNIFKSKERVSMYLSGKKPYFPATTDI